MISVKKAYHLQGSISFFNRFFLILNDRISLLSNRGVRAPRVLNFMQGLDIHTIYPLSPFATKNDPAIEEEDEFEFLHHPIPQEKRILHIVDGGLAMNIPFAPILRPQRATDIIISFEFTARLTDDGREPNFDPLKQVRLAEKWAKIHNLEFPKVPILNPKEPLKEVYVIKDDNPNTPVIIHFLLVNSSYRNYSKPGVKRSPTDDRGNFAIFENPSNVYSTFNFTYDQAAFDQLARLMEYNVLNNIEVIKREIAEGVQMRRRYRTRCTISRKDIESSSMREKEKERFPFKGHDNMGYF